MQVNTTRNGFHSQGESKYKVSHGDTLPYTNHPQLLSNIFSSCDDNGDNKGRTYLEMFKSFLERETRLDCSHCWRWAINYFYYLMQYVLHPRFIRLCKAKYILHLSWIRRSTARGRKGRGVLNVAPSSGVVVRSGGKSLSSNDSQFISELCTYVGAYICCLRYPHSLYRRSNKRLHWFQNRTAFNSFPLSSILVTFLLLSLWQGSPSNFWGARDQEESILKYSLVQPPLHN